MTTENSNPNTQTVPATVPATVPGSAAFDHSEFSATYEKRLPEILQVKEDDLVFQIIDVDSAPLRVLGVMPEIRKFAERMVALPELDKALVENLEDYAEASAEANVRYTAAITPEDDIVSLNEEATRLREILRSDATALAIRGLLNREHFEKFQGNTGYKNVGYELAGWASVMKDSWPRIGGKTALTIEELSAAKNLGDRLMRAAGRHEQAPVTVAEAARIRRQALSLVVNAYDEARRAIAYLRWREEDLEHIAPSLYVRNRKPSKEDPRPAPASPPFTVPGTTAAPATGAPAPSPAATTPQQGVPSALPFTAN